MLLSFKKIIVVLTCLFCLNNSLFGVQVHEKIQKMEVEQVVVTSAIWATLLKLVADKNTSWTQAIGVGLLLSLHQSLVSETSQEVPEEDLPFARPVEKSWSIENQDGQWFYQKPDVY